MGYRKPQKIVRNPAVTMLREERRYRRGVGVVLP
jgi:hypothetical protein